MAITIYVVVAVLEGSSLLVSAYLQLGISSTAKFIGVGFKTIRYGVRPKLEEQRSLPHPLDYQKL